MLLCPGAVAVSLMESDLIPTFCHFAVAPRDRDRLSCLCFPTDFPRDAGDCICIHNKQELSVVEQQWIFAH